MGPNSFFHRSFILIFSWLSLHSILVYGGKGLVVDNADLAADLIRDVMSTAPFMPARPSCVYLKEDGHSSTEAYEFEALRNPDSACNNDTHSTSTFHARVTRDGGEVTFDFDSYGTSYTVGANDNWKERIIEKTGLSFMYPAGLLDKEFSGPKRPNYWSYDSTDGIASFIYTLADFSSVDEIAKENSKSCIGAPSLMLVKPKLVAISCYVQGNQIHYHKSLIEDGIETRFDAYYYTNRRYFWDWRISRMADSIIPAKHEQ